MTIQGKRVIDLVRVSYTPAAFRWALTIVRSTKWVAQSTCPSEIKSACSSESIRSNTPASHHLRKRLCMVDHDPFLSGISRQDAPVLTFQRIQLMFLRWSSASRPVSGFWGGMYSLIFCQCFSLISCLLFIHGRVFTQVITRRYLRSNKLRS